MRHGRADRPDRVHPVVRPGDEVAVQFWIIQSFNSVAYGMLLFLLSAGLSLILGMMKIATQAHGAF